MHDVYPLFVASSHKRHIHNCKQTKVYNSNATSLSYDSGYTHSLVPHVCVLQQIKLPQHISTINVTKALRGPT